MFYHILKLSQNCNPMSADTYVGYFITYETPQKIILGTRIGAHVMFFGLDITMMVI